MTHQTSKSLPRIYPFLKKWPDKNPPLKDLLGSKGANLAEMTRLGLPVPPGFIITTEVCAQALNHQGELSPGLIEEIKTNVSSIEKDLKQTFGRGPQPLLLSVRSGAAVSMPGMMDTILNLGLNSQTVQVLALETNNPEFAYDSFRRFIMMYSEIVGHVPRKLFDKEYEKIKSSQVNLQKLKKLCETFKLIYKKETKKKFPEDPWHQLEQSIKAVFHSWNNPRAIEYRRLHHIKGLRGTAVTVQAMVFGNKDKNSASGVAFTRDPATGKNELYCDLLFQAQGEDVVAGTHTPENATALKRQLPHVYEQLNQIRQTLEEHFKDMQDIEFTVESKKLFILQTRSGKRTAQAALRIATEMVAEGLLTRQEALLSLNPASLNQLLHPTFDPHHLRNVLVSGIPASPGAAKGKVVFSPERAKELASQKEDVILVRQETNADDIHGMVVAKGIVTSRGGRTSHAAVVARQMGKPCIAGISDMKVDEENHLFIIGTQMIKEGEMISIDGSTGEVMLGASPMIPPTLDDVFLAVMNWADEYKKLGVRANADTPQDALKAKELGAQGIGLCRTEHMFFKEDRIQKMREVILAPNDETRRRALQQLTPMQEKDFFEIFKIMNRLPVTIRLLDPPLHEFLPKDLDQQESLAKELGISSSEISQTTERLNEANPMLGFRGCRLGILHPEIYQMQVRAIIQAAQKAHHQGMIVKPQIMIPFIAHVEELKILRQMILELIEEMNQINPIGFQIPLGTMIEVPRAALTADQIAKEADFFSFGTNDLTQMTVGLSRDDAEGGFLERYIEQDIFSKSPFMTLDTQGVGQLVSLATKLGRQSQPNLEVGICGEHGGDPDSINFFHQNKLDYVSCSPYRLPTARLAAAQAALKSSSISANLSPGAQISLNS